MKDRPLTQFVCQYLISLGHFRDSNAVGRRTAEVASTFQSVDYSYHLSEDLDVSLLYLPPAFDHLTNWRPEMESTAEAVARYCMSWRAQLIEVQLWDAVKAEMLHLLSCWSARYLGDKDGRVTDIESLRSVMQSKPFALFLNAALEADRSQDAEYLHLVKLWLDRAESADGCAHVIDFFLTLRMFPFDGLIFRHTPTLQLAFDTTRIGAAWANAKALMRRRCGAMHLKALKTCFDLI